MDDGIGIIGMAGGMALALAWHGIMLWLAASKSVLEHSCCIMHMHLLAGWLPGAMPAHGMPLRVRRPID
eukprot:COSAG01_NODE_4995_length_4559_cov_6.424439_8_plen_69_part_00